MSNNVGEQSVLDNIIGMYTIYVTFMYVNIYSLKYKILLKSVKTIHNDKSILHRKIGQYKLTYTRLVELEREIEQGVASTVLHAAIQSLIKYMYIYKPNMEFVKFKQIIYTQEFLKCIPYIANENGSYMNMGPNEYSLNNENNLYDTIDVNSFADKTIRIARGHYIQYNVPIFHLKPVDVPILEDIMELVSNRQSINNLYLKYKNNVQEGRKALSFIVNNRYLKLESLRYRLYIYMLRQNRFQSYHNINGSGYKKYNVRNKINALQNSMSIIDVAIHLLEKSIVPYHMDVDFVFSGCKESKQTFGGETTHLYTNDGIELDVSHGRSVQEMESIINTLSKSARKNRLETMFQPYIHQFAELVRRAQDNDIQLQRRHRVAIGWGDNEYPKRTASSELLNILKGVNPDYLDILKTKYIDNLKSTLLALDQNLANYKVNQYGTDALRRDRDAVAKEIQKLEKFSLSNLYDDSNDNSINLARKWIINEYANYMENILHTSRSMLDEMNNMTRYNIETTASQHDKTSTPIPRSMNFLYPSKYIDLINLEKTTTTGKMAMIRKSIVGLHMRSLDILPMEYLILKSDSVNLLEYIRELDIVFEQKPNRSYVAIAIFTLGMSFAERNNRRLENLDSLDTFEFVMQNTFHLWKNEGVESMFRHLEIPQRVTFEFYKLASTMNDPDPMQQNIIDHFDYLTKNQESPFLKLYKEMYARGDIVYYNILAIAKDRMYDHITCINELHESAFNSLVKGIECLKTYTDSTNAAFSLSRCLIRLQFLRSTRDDLDQIIPIMWTTLIKVFESSFNDEDVVNFKTQYGSAVYQILMEMIDLIGNVFSGKKLRHVKPFYKCFIHLQHIPYEVANVILDLIYIILHTNSEQDKFFEILSTFRLIDEKVSSCELARNVWDLVATDLIRDEDTPIPVAGVNCSRQPHIINDIQALTRKICHLVTLPSRKFLLSHIPSRYELVYSEYRYAYLPRELKNIFDDAYYYFNLKNEAHKNIFEIFNLIVIFARNPERIKDDNYKDIFRYLSTRYSQCVLYNTNVSELGDENPLIMLYSSLNRLMRSIHSTTSRQIVFENYIKDMTALYQRLKDPDSVVGPRTHAVICFEKFFLDDKKLDALASIRKLVSLPPLTEYPEINIYNQRHVLHLAWKYILEMIRDVNTNVTREILKQLSQYVGSNDDLPLNTFVTSTRNLFHYVARDQIQNWNVCDNVILMLYDYCELKTVYTRTPAHAMVYPAELQNLLLELENSLDIHRCSGLFMRYFSGLIMVFKDFAKELSPFTLVNTNYSIFKEIPDVNVGTPESLYLSIQRHERLCKWPMSFIYNINQHIDAIYSEETVFNILTTIVMNKLVFFPSPFTTYDQTLYQWSNFLHESICLYPPRLLDYLNPRKIEEFDLKLKMGYAIRIGYNNSIRNDKNPIITFITNFINNIEDIDTELFTNELRKLKTRSEVVEYLHMLSNVISIERSCILTKLLRTEFLNRQDWIVRYLRLILKRAKKESLVRINHDFINSINVAKNDDLLSPNKLDTVQSLNHLLLQDTLRLFLIRKEVLGKLMNIDAAWKLILLSMRVNVNVNDDEYKSISKHHSLFNRKMLFLLMSQYDNNEMLSAIKSTDKLNTFTEVDPSILSSKTSLQDREDYFMLHTAIVGAEEAIDMMRDHIDNMKDYDTLDDAIDDELEQLLGGVIDLETMGEQIKLWSIYVMTINYEF
ncbi:uncharacterized protein ISCGN_028356 [Ixodes scapularis]